MYLLRKWLKAMIFNLEDPKDPGTCTTFSMEILFDRPVSREQFEAAFFEFVNDLAPSPISSKVIGFN
jgi:hypothetical protein